ncbi:unnamed protein product [Cyberlindnera jadinii]|uniref:Prefoldin beta-like protein n=1 Tax=Cyberlindnera jadinii (strain ATCC 18201 / CBS 1600 / BCRC 20928 / JCM 3617 / NBRC 0987 / NRRL Y-1542) TaxID=983966 RepID=A0A0H5C6D2_CYBJN|nr:Prefoldin beta-like protein [Cyberlindnera jadinii NRRL Y-1542]ODV71992.1 Prefoldin beta-like protein [Cyberlindnera jadinii NRRL Y-1542]CEP23715.1 unnamed protein product [Cyberlindnera jadinii]
MSSAGLQEQYNNYQTTLTDIQAKIQELRMDAEENRIVKNTLETTDPSRRCFRMVGGVLVQSNVEETLPVLDLKLANLQKAIQQLSTEAVKLNEEFTNWKKEKNIKVIKQ